MLLKIELTNFFSIKETVCIDFRAANIKTVRTKELADNIITWNGTHVLKSIGLFGPNASGKSNIMRAIKFCCHMILDSHQHNEGVTFNFLPFKFDGWQDKPSRFFVSFVCDDVEYEYSFELTTKEVVSESLYYYPNGRRAKIFTRDERASNVYSFGEGVMQRPQDIALNTSRQNLFLSRASSMNRDIARKVYSYFLIQFILGVGIEIDDTMEQDFKDYKELILRAMGICDSDIVDIEQKYEKGSVLFPSIEGNSITVTPQEREIVKYVTYHQADPNIPFDMDTDESQGTRRLFYMLLQLLDVLRNGKSIMIDEFDASLHTRLADFIIDLTHASAHSQLLFTSHNTNLIDVRRLRRDQILFVNKKEDASTDVYSLYDYKDFRENMDAEKAYIQGRFDAVPYIESSVSNLKSLLEK